MGKGKLRKFQDMDRMPNVFQYPYGSLLGPDGRLHDAPMKGWWRKDIFHHDGPLTLELGCGKGEYTLALARLHPERLYIGIDIKGARMWTGARQATEEGLQNVAFLRTSIELLPLFFAPREADEIWLTFSDPQMKNHRKRLSGPMMLERYRLFLKDGGTVHLKTDSNFLFTYTLLLLNLNGIKPLMASSNIDSLPPSTDPETLEALSIRTYYESQWRERGIDIKYLCFALGQGPALKEPQDHIEPDPYRSFGRNRRPAPAANGETPA